MTTALDVSRIWASNPPTNGGVLDPGLTKYAQGWVAEIPSFQYLNYLQWRTDTNMRALAERGIMGWGTDVSYEQGALAWDDADNSIYINDTGNNGTTSPSTDPLNWSLSSVSISAETIEFIREALEAHEALVNNPHGVTAAQAGTLTTAQLETLLDENRAAIDAHVDIIVGNPHGTTATQVGAVPVGGGTYTGPVTHTAITTYGTGTLDATTGFLMTLGTSSLGISDAGVPVANGEALLYEENYLEQKLLHEPDFAVPAPDFLLPLTSDINIYHGVGMSGYVGSAGLTYLGKDGQTATTTLDTPAFGRYGMYFTGEGAVIPQLDVEPVGNISGWRQMTLSYRGRFTSVPTESCELIKLNTADPFPRFIVSGLGILEIQLNNALSIPCGPAPLDTYYTLAMTFDGSTVRVYRDGVLIETVPSAVVDVINMIRYHCTHTSGVHYMKDIRHWSLVLTDEQIATL